MIRTLASLGLGLVAFLTTPAADATFEPLTRHIVAAIDADFRDGPWTRATLGPDVDPLAFDLADGGAIVTATDTLNSTTLAATLTAGGPSNTVGSAGVHYRLAFFVDEPGVYRLSGTMVGDGAFGWLRHPVHGDRFVIPRDGESDLVWLTRTGYEIGLQAGAWLPGDASARFELRAEREVKPIPEPATLLLLGLGLAMLARGGAPDAGF